MNEDVLKSLDKVNQDLLKKTKAERKLLAQEAKNFAKNSLTKIHFTDKQLRVIVTALSCFYRLRSGRVGIAMDEAYKDKDISYDDRETIEKVVRTIAFKGIQHPHSYYGFSSPQLKDGTLAFEIEKTLDEYLSVKNNDGYWGSGCNFNSPLKTTQEPLPIIEGFADYKDFPLTRAQTKKILPHYHNNDYKKMWEVYDSLKLGLPKGEKYQITTGQFTGKEAKVGGSNERLIVRVTKPRKE